jgi:hypothetical protein
MIYPLCLVARRKVEGAEQQRPAGSCQPLKTIVPHDELVSSALMRIKAALEAGPCQELAPVDGELVYAAAVQAACMALNNFSTPPILPGMPCPLLL